MKYNLALWILIQIAITTKNTCITNKLFQKKNTILHINYKHAVYIIVFALINGKYLSSKLVLAVSATPPSKPENKAYKVL